MPSSYRSPLAQREVPTAVLIHRALSTFELPALRQIEAKLHLAIQEGLLQKQGQAALDKVRRAITRRELDLLFTADSRRDAAEATASARSDSRVLPL